MDSLMKNFDITNIATISEDGIIKYNKFMTICRNDLSVWHNCGPHHKAVTLFLENAIKSREFHKIVNIYNTLFAGYDKNWIVRNACRRNDIEMLNYLVDNLDIGEDSYPLWRPIGNDVEIRGYLKYWYLLTACRENNIEIVKILLDKMPHIYVDDILHEMEIGTVLNWGCDHVYPNEGYLTKTDISDEVKELLVQHSFSLDSNNYNENILG